MKKRELQQRYYYLKCNFFFFGFLCSHQSILCRCPNARIYCCFLSKFRKWSRREEADFYRTISSFGVEYNEEKKEYNWSRFRGIARLERKYDETLAEYYKCFYAMCKRVCGRDLTEEEGVFMWIHFKCIKKCLLAIVFM